MMNNETIIPDDLVAMLDEYEIVAELGRGGVSVVYLARERELDREVAIKVIRNRFLEDTEARARTDREARTLASLHHPNIVTLLGARRLPDGRLALIMQLAQGATLRAMLKEEGAFPIGRTVEVLRQVASALGYLHNRGIVHRDVKPENVFLEDDGRVLLSDLGIAKANDVPMDVTLTGVIVGTPAYMSPEQIDGSPLDGRSDQYSLGLLAHELLTGRKPWDGENLYGVIFKQKNEALPPLAELRPDSPLFLREAVERALAKDPADRWPSMEALLEHLAHRVPPRITLPAIVAAPGWEPAAEAAAEAAAAAVAPSPGPPAGTVPAGGVLAVRTRRRWAAIAVLMLAIGGSAALAIGGPGTVERLVAWFALEPAEPATAAEAAPELPAPSAATTPRPATDITVAGFAPGADPEPGDGGSPGAGETVRTTAPRAGVAPARSPAVVAPAPLPRGAAAPVPGPLQTGEAPRTEPDAPVRAAETLVAVGGSLRPRVAGQPERAAPGTSAAIQNVPAPAERYSAPTLQNMADVSSHVAAQYPLALARRNIGGTVGLVLHIDVQGRVSAARVASSSGHAELDAVALRAARRMRFSPAERNGVPVDAEIRVPLQLHP